MSLGMLFFVGWMIFMAVISVIFFIWGWESGQFKDIEEAKYRMLEDNEPQPWPDREKPQVNEEDSAHILQEKGGPV